MHNHEISFSDLIAPEYQGVNRDEWQRALNARENFRHEYEIVTRLRASANGCWRQGQASTRRTAR